MYRYTLVARNIRLYVHMAIILKHRMSKRKNVQRNLRISDLRIKMYHVCFFCIIESHYLITWYAICCEKLRAKFKAKQDFGKSNTLRYVKIDNARLDNVSNNERHWPHVIHSRVV